MRDDRDAIIEALNICSRSQASGDPERCTALWDENGIRMAPNTPPVVAKRRIDEQTQRTLERFTVRTAIDNKEVEVAGDWAFVRGFYTETKTSKKTGEQFFVDGKYLTIFRRQEDGSWKIYRECSNTNVPPT